MTTWKIEPKVKKSVIETNVWYNEDSSKSITVTTGWRWGEFTVETESDDPPEIDEDTDLLCSDDFEMVDFSTDDGCWEEHEFDGEWTDEEREEMEERLDGDISIYDLEDEGWYCDSSEMYIQCEVEITKVE